VAITSKQRFFPTYYGPEYIRDRLMAWAEKRNIRLEYIQPGKPQQNAYIERYNRTVRGECWAYTNERANMGIGGITPAMKLKTAA